MCDLLKLGSMRLVLTVELYSSWLGSRVRTPGLENKYQARARIRQVIGIWVVADSAVLPVWSVVDLGNVTPSKSSLLMMFSVWHSNTCCESDIEFYSSNNVQNYLGSLYSRNMQHIFSYTFQPILLLPWLKLSPNFTTPFVTEWMQTKIKVGADFVFIKKIKHENIFLHIAQMKLLIWLQKCSL